MIIASVLRSERDTSGTFLVRQSTVTIKHGEDILNKKLIEQFFDKWTEDNEQLLCSIWQDKSHVYAQFAEESIKKKFIDECANEALGPLTLKLI